MVIKRVLVPQRVRTVPRQFGWVDRRLLSEGYIERCDAAALGLYLLLVIVADAQGVSFYSDAKLQRLLSVSAPELTRVRTSLIHAGLIAYRAPLYQVLSLDGPTPPRVSGLKPLGTTLQQLQRKWPVSTSLPLYSQA